MLYNKNKSNILCKFVTKNKMSSLNEPFVFRKREGAVYFNVNSLLRYTAQNLD